MTWPDGSSGVKYAISCGCNPGRPDVQDEPEDGLCLTCREDVQSVPVIPLAQYEAEVERLVEVGIAATGAAIYFASLPPGAEMDRVDLVDAIGVARDEAERLRSELTEAARGRDDG